MKVGVLWRKIGDEDGPFLTWFYRLMFFAVVPVLFVMGAVIGVSTFPQAWDAAQARGTVGTFVGTGRECDRRGCSWIGTFTPSDGGPVLTGARYHHDPRALRDGESVQVRDTGSRAPTVLYEETGSVDWMWSIVIVVLCVGLLGGLAWFAWWVLADEWGEHRERQRRKRRKRRRDEDG